MEHIDPRKLAILVDLANEAEGKSLNQSLPFIMNASNKLKSQNLSFTKDESNLLIQILSEGLSPAEKQKLEMMYQMFNL